MHINLSPIVALNRAVAVGMAQGPAAGLDAAAQLAGDSALAGYHLLPSVRGDLLMKMGKLTEARQEIQRAIAMTRNPRGQELLADRLKQALSGWLLRLPASRSLYSCILSVTVC
jgi:predicted RNA polymerase sigma factor